MVITTIYLIIYLHMQRARRPRSDRSTTLLPPTLCKRACGTTVVQENGSEFSNKIKFKTGENVSTRDAFGLAPSSCKLGALLPAPRRDKFPAWKMAWIHAFCSGNARQPRSRQCQRLPQTCDSRRCLRSRHGPPIAKCDTRCVANRKRVRPCCSNKIPPVGIHQHHRHTVLYDRRPML